MNHKTINRRITIVMISTFTLFLLFSIQFISTVDSALKMPIEYEDPNIKRGNFYDTNMAPITYYDEMGDRIYNDGYIFSPMLGYDSKKYGRAGLESKLNNSLLYSDSKHKQGNDIILTINSDIQKSLLDAISDFEGKSASGVIINANTGEILGMANYPSYDPSKIDEDFEALTEVEGIFVNKAVSPIIPGSVFKLIMASLFVREGIHEDIFFDNGVFKVEGFTIRNYGGAKYGNIFMKEGIGYSVNTYFASKGVEMGGTKIKNMFDMYLIGKDILLDFIILKSYYNIRSSDEAYSDLMIASTAFGQGETLISPLHMAMITSTIANGGKFNKAYIVKEIVDFEGNQISSGSTEKIADVLTQSQCDAIKAGMRIAADNLNLDRTLDIYIKTGTAQTDANGSLNNWITCILNHMGETYVITIAVLDDSERNLKTNIESIISSIIKSYT